MTQRHITLKIRERNTNSDIVETINTDGADLTLLNGALNSSASLSVRFRRGQP
jgi:hypothetical protein